jgi:hypothetical protein
MFAPPGLIQSGPVVVPPLETSPSSTTLPELEDDLLKDRVPNPIAHAAELITSIFVGLEFRVRTLRFVLSIMLIGTAAVRAEKKPQTDAQQDGLNGSVRSVFMNNQETLFSLTRRATTAHFLLRGQRRKAD